MKKILLASLLLFFPIVAHASVFTWVYGLFNPKPPVSSLEFGDINIRPLDQFTSTTSPADAITQRTFGKTLRLTGYSAGCIEATSNGTLTSTGIACGTGSGGGSGDSVFSRTVATGLIYHATNTDSVVFGLTSTSSATVPSLYINNVDKRVGVGTSTPRNLLHVASLASDPVRVTSAITSTIKIESNAPTTTGLAAFQIFRKTPDTGNLEYGWDVSSNVDLLNDNFAIRTLNYNAAEGSPTRLTITRPGLVGIGSTTPWGLLSVNPNALGNRVPEFVIGSSTKTNFIVDGTGNVGLGMANPNYKLEINSNGILGFRDSAGSGTTYDAVLSQSIASPFRIFTINQKAGTGAWRGAINFDTNYNAGTTFTAMTIRANTDGLSANVGIGTTSALTKLQIESTTVGAGDAKIRLSTASGNINQGDIIGTVDFWTNDQSVAGVGTTSSIHSEAETAFTGATRVSSLVFSTAATTVNTEKLRITGAGNVGIGTNNPLRLLTLSRTDTTDAPSVAQTTGIRIVNPSTVVGDGAMIQFGHDNADAQMNAQISEVLTSTANQWTGDLAISLKRDTAITTLTEYFRFRTGGNFGAGTTTPNWTMQIASATPYFALTDTNAPVDTKHWLISNGDGQFKIGTSSDALNSTSTPAIIINNNGNVGIGGAATTNKLEVTGAVNVSTTIAAGTSVAVGSTFMGSNQFTTTGIGQMNFSSRSAISSPADGQLLISNGGFTDFTRLQLGGTTSAFPALGRTLNSLTVIAGDGTTNANLGVGTTTPRWSLQIASTTPYFVITDTNAPLNAKHGLIGFSDGQFTFGTSSDALNSTSTTNTFTVTLGGHIYASTTAPTLSSGVIDGTDAGGRVLGCTSACTITFAQPYSRIPSCVVTPETQSIVNALSYVPTATTLTVTQTSLGTFNFTCRGQ